MRNIAVELSYDGTDFAGWQKQVGRFSNVRTVQGELERALEKICKTNITLYGSGRTDSGVHAFRQLANFFSPLDTFPTEKFPLVLNALLPNDVRVINACEKDEKFSARKSAVSRIYRYFLMEEKNVTAVNSRFVLPVKKFPNSENVNALAKVLHGEMNCASFAAAGDASLSTNRFLYGARFFFDELFFHERVLVFEIEANAFLWKMVRTILGTILQLEKSGASAKDFENIIVARDRKKAGATIASQGLFLWKVNLDGKRVHA